MTPTLSSYSYALIDKTAYSESDPEVGDIVAIRVADMGNALKRIVACGGETIKMDGGRVLVDGKYRDFLDVDGQLSPAAKTAIDGIHRAFGVQHPYRVPEEQFFVLGDNRIASYDSRDFGAIGREGIIGRVGQVFELPEVLRCYLGAGKGDTVKQRR